jgi:hypothetical protein
MPTKFKRRAISVDPAISMRKGTDATGIVDLGLGIDDQVFVLGDYTERIAWEAWGALVIELYVRGACDCVIVERNRGGDAVVANLRACAERRGIRVEVVEPKALTRHAPNVVYVKETISRKSKALRAEPVATMYERGLVSHVNGADLAELEDQMTTWQPEGGGESPNALDALVHGVHELAGLGRDDKPPSDVLGAAKLQACYASNEVTERRVNALGRDRTLDWRARWTYAKKQSTALPTNYDATNAGALFDRIWFRVPFEVAQRHARELFDRLGLVVVDRHLRHLTAAAACAWCATRRCASPTPSSRSCEVAGEPRRRRGPRLQGGQLRRRDAVPRCEVERGVSLGEVGAHLGLVGVGEDVRARRGLGVVAEVDRAHGEITPVCTPRSMPRGRSGSSLVATPKSARCRRRARRPASRARRRCRGRCARRPSRRPRRAWPTPPTPASC